MKVFLNGGGADIQTIDAYERLNQIIDESKPCLYIPLAMTQEKYDSCYEWITGELNDVKVSHIDMVRSAEELLTKNLNDYSFLFIGGGNTFKLLHDLKKSGRGWIRTTEVVDGRFTVVIRFCFKFSIIESLNFNPNKNEKKQTFNN